MFIEQLSVEAFQRHVRSYAAYRLASMRGVIVKDVNDPYAAEAWFDYLAVAREIT